MGDNLQAAKVFTPLADETLSASAKTSHIMCVYTSVCER